MIFIKPSSNRLIVFTDRLKTRDFLDNKVNETKAYVAKNNVTNARLKRSSIFCNVMFPECSTQFAWAVPMRNGLLLPKWYYRLLGTEESPIFNELDKMKTILHEEKEKFDKCKSSILNEQVS